MTLLAHTTETLLVPPKHMWLNPWIIIIAVLVLKGTITGWSRKIQSTDLLKGLKWWRASPRWLRLQGTFLWKDKIYQEKEAKTGNGPDLIFAENSDNFFQRGSREYRQMSLITLTRAKSDIFLGRYKSQYRLGISEDRSWCEVSRYPCSSIAHRIQSPWAGMKTILPWLWSILKWSISSFLNLGNSHLCPQW